MMYNENDILMHYGTPRHSGRYPYGSGENPYQHCKDFLSRVEKLKSEGKSETEIAKEIGLTTTQLRIQKSLARSERRSQQVATAKSLKKKGYSNAEIGRKMGLNESTIRSLFNKDSEAKMNEAQKTAEFLKQQIDEKGMIDVGKGVEKELNVSREKLNEALYILELEGYPNYGGGVPQVTNRGRQTNIKVVCPPGTEHKDIYNYNEVNSIHEYVSHDGGDTFDKLVYPKSMDSKRIQIRYAEDGGIAKDGIIELRRGVEDLSLGESNYAQVRILVDDKKYLKGMAVYSDNMPDGVDIVFNTNKKKGTPKLDVLKDIGSDPDNPFGALIKAGGQSYYEDKNGKRQLSLINKTREEGDWGEWADHLSSQFLSKQRLDLARKQLSLSAADKVAEFEEICSLTNPTVKKTLLQSFADDCDAAAVHLKAAALPRQKYQVILPVTSMKDNEVYAPNYKNGEKVALVRYPHGGTFEIPILTVNNRQSDAKKMLGNALDAIGINSKVAERLSGADFDGDTVMVIPTGKSTKITSTQKLEGLEGFDPKMAYPYKEGMKVMKNTQKEMGVVSNLITDMTLKGATKEELARAVRHSMVVIDAEKHKLNYKQSEIDNNIAGLKRRYQGRVDEDGRYHEGASTLISRARSEQSVIKRKGSPRIDKETGELIWKTVDEPTYIDKKTGKTKLRTQASTKMYEAKDARTLISDLDSPMERVYADYANRMKALGNQARKEMISTKSIPYDAQAKKVYLNEANSLDAKLNVALKNAPRERKAQLIANTAVEAKKQEYGLTNKKDAKEIKKISQQELTKARLKVGAHRETIKITDKEWEAIQAGAISKGKLESILKYTDIDEIRERATPRTKTVLSSAKMAKINAMKSSGYTTAEIAEAIGVSPSTVSKYLR